MIQFYKTTLIKGEVGSGKSVYINTYLQPLLGNDEYRLILIDPKVVEMHHLKDVNNVIYVCSDVCEYIKNELLNDLTRIKNYKTLIVIDEYADVSFDKDANKVIESLFGCHPNVKLILSSQIKTCYSKAMLDKADAVLELKHNY